MEIMKALLDKGADVNKRGGDYGTALQVYPIIDVAVFRC